jgi:hypothetical protein
MAKLFSSRIKPLDAWVLIRIPEVAKESRVLTAEKGDDGKMRVHQGVAARNIGIVVDVGPGARSDHGDLVPVNPEIRPGVTVCFFGKGLFRPPDFEREMESEGLFLLAADAIVFVLQPEGVRGPQAITA